jgi:hypothetical protein
LICILYALVCEQNFILVKSGCYIVSAEDSGSEENLCDGFELHPT